MKSIKIENDVYYDTKEYCNENALKISRWISKIIRERLIEEKRKEVDAKMP